ncbi:MULTISPECIES: NAD(P)/FAD-dependent oxidoreductase [Deinococcus]|jgi:NADH dehydrogenase|uniref:NADH dehydrogenase subunit n=2 Tax=Deinococcus TaxID=1298 RepID=A0A221SWQ4_9DEIO|nr:MULTISPECIES: NAD(P)/FAD-dependent oxidoreductase [Deinococcus]ASN81079.1 NADH dehydrogenase subunit [Deinococcus ficus]MDP9763121.1 NADH dehydrogenase [Deinococcus enclensis]
MNTLILGAGYAGLATATSLKPDPRMTTLLVEQNNYHTFETRLHEAAAHNTRVTVPLVPLLRGTGVHWEQAAVKDVNVDTREVTLKDGRVLTYDTLVVALGSTTNFYRIPGLAENAVELKDIQDADEIFHYVNRAYASDYQGHRDIVVGGAGLTGVELVTELARRAEKLTKARGLPPMNIYLVEAGPKILPVLDDALRAKAQRTLDEYGIHTLTGHRLMKATADSVTVQTQGGQQKVIPAGKIIWTGGIQARDLVKGDRLEKGPGGRIAVDEFLRARGYPEVFVLGDMGLALNEEGHPVPTTAQHAGQQGRVTAGNLRRLARGEALTPYVPSTLGEFVSLGGLMAVGWMKLPWNQKLAITGGMAHVMKRASEWKWRQSID